MGTVRSAQAGWVRARYALHGNVGRYGYRHCRRRDHGAYWYGDLGAKTLSHTRRACCPRCAVRMNPGVRHFSVTVRRYVNKLRDVVDPSHTNLTSWALRESLLPGYD